MEDIHVFLFSSWGLTFGMWDFWGFRWKGHEVVAVWHLINFRCCGLKFLTSVDGNVFASREIWFLVDFHDQNPRQCSGDDYGLCSELTYIIVKKCCLVDNVGASIKLWFAHLNIVDILVWNGTAKTHAVGALYPKCASFGYRILWM